MRHDESSPSVLKRLCNFCAVKAPATSKNFFEPREETSTQKSEGILHLEASNKVAMPDQFLVFEKVLKKRRRTWKWRVSTPEGDVILHGSESRRPAANYQADRALFLLLLSAPYQSFRRAARAEAVSKVTLGLALLVLSEITTDRQNLADLLF